MLSFVPRIRHPDRHGKVSTMLKKMILWVLLIFVGHGAGATEVVEYQLDNGLKILVKTDHRAPVVVSQIWYKVGSSYEYSGITGISHILEHMMFKGTERFPPGEFSRIIAANGGRENAFTGRDYTAYYQQLEKSRLKVSFEMEADRMRNLALTEKEARKEIQVVAEERRLRVEDRPQQLAVEHFTATAFINGPYQHPVIGWMDDILNTTLDDLKNWYQTWYAPNNATLVVVGDVDPPAVLELARQYYGPVQPGEIPKVKPRREVEQKGMRRLIVKAKAELPLLVMGWKVPVVRTASEPWEPYALDVLGEILDGSQGARFSQRLVRGQEIAASTDVSYNLFSRHDGLFTIDAVPAAQHSVTELEAAIREQIEQLRKTPPTDDELARVKAQTIAAKVYEQDSVFYQAMILGTLATVGLDWRLSDQYAENISKVTAQQVQEVVKKYFIDDALTVGILEPQTMITASAARNDEESAP